MTLFWYVLSTTYRYVLVCTIIHFKFLYRYVPVRTQYYVQVRTKTPSLVPVQRFTIPDEGTVKNQDGAGHVVTQSLTADHDGAGHAVSH